MAKNIVFFPSFFLCLLVYIFIYAIVPGYTHCDSMRPTAFKERAQAPYPDVVLEALRDPNKTVEFIRFIRLNSPIAFHGCSGAKLSDDPNSEFVGHAASVSDVIERSTRGGFDPLEQVYVYFAFSVGYGFQQMEDVRFGRHGPQVKDAERALLFDEIIVSEDGSRLLPHVLVFDGRILNSANPPEFSIKRYRMDAVISLTAQEFKRIWQRYEGSSDPGYIDNVRLEVTKLMFEKFFDTIRSPTFLAKLNDSMRGVVSGWYLQEYRDYLEGAI